MLKLVKTILLVLLAVDLMVWYFIFSPGSIIESEFYFLKVGQGDSSLAVLPDKNGGYAKFLIDGGPLNGNLQTNLEKILGSDRYIDILVITHPEIDHYGGFIELLKNYKIGAVVFNGAESDNVNWKELNKVMADKKIAKIPLYKGERIIYSDANFQVLHSSDSYSAGTNEAGLVLLYQGVDSRALFAADIGAATEKILVLSENIQADILKVGHHGSKYSSTLNFLKKVNPKVSVIEFGKNSYGHPSKEALANISAVGSKIFNTYDQGIIKIVRRAGNLRVFNISEL